MSKVQNAERQKKALDELYRRYEDRGMTYESDSVKKRSLEGASRTYRISEKGKESLKKHKNGVAGSRKHISDKDFANYYRASREYTPQSNVELDTTILLQKIDRARYKKEKAPMKDNKKDIKRMLKAEADKNNPKGLAQKREEKASKPLPKQGSGNASSKPSKIKQVAKEAAKTWIPLEERNSERIVEGGKTKLPTKLILAIIVITVSLLMIVASAVLLGSAQRRQNDLKDAIEDLDFQIAELETDLNKKNEDLDIEFFAQEVLGMINQEHADAEYINSNKTDGVIKHESNKASIASLIDWIFQLLK